MSRSRRPTRSSSPPDCRRRFASCCCDVLKKEPADRPTVNVLAAALEAAGAPDVVRLKMPVQTAGLATPVAPVQVARRGDRARADRLDGDASRSATRAPGAAGRGNAWRGSVAPPGQRPVPGDPAANDVGWRGDRGRHPARGPQAPEADRARHAGAGGRGSHCRRRVAPIGPDALVPGAARVDTAPAPAAAPAPPAPTAPVPAPPASDGGHHADRGAGRGNYSPRWAAGLRSPRRSAG